MSLAAISLGISLALCLWLGRRLATGNRALEAELGDRGERTEATVESGAMRADEEFFETVLRDMMEGVLVVGPKAEFLLVNPAFERVLGTPTQPDAAPADWLDLYRPLDPQTGQRLREEQLTLPRALRGETVESEVVFRATESRKGSRVEVRAQPIRDATGVIRGAFSILRDVTASRRAEAERARLIADLEQRNDGLERFNDTVSHDLRNALVSIKESLADLEHSTAIEDIERAQRDVDRIGGAATEMKHLLDELLELSRVSRRPQPPSEGVDPNRR